jgi:glyoxylase-like metal-dependent hydrolase (beta-lactamase superfamily II)
MTTVHLARRSLGELLLFTVALTTALAAQSGTNGPTPGAAGEPYPNMPSIAPIGDRTDKYFDIPESAKGPAIDPAKGYRIQDFGKGLYLVTDNAIQSLFMVYDNGVVLIDAPQALVPFIPKAIAEVTTNPITHIIYSHAHADHIGGTRAIGGKPIIIAQAETAKWLKRDNDPERPLPTVTFTDHYSLRLGGQVLDLSYHGSGHLPGNTFIYAPAQRVLVTIDLIFPGWMPWRRFAVAEDVFGHLAQVEEISKMDWDVVVGGHVERVGTHADVATQVEFNRDIKEAAANALKTTPLGVGLNPLDKGNPWALFDNYIDRVALQCVNTLTPKWSSRLAAFDVYIWDQCYSMEQTLRID